MKCMNINKVTFFYALYEKRVALTDDYGNSTGEYEVLRGNPIEFSANISPAEGEATSHVFGDSESYDKVMVMNNNAPTLDIYSVLWIDTAPLLDNTGSLALDESGKVIAPYDYIVKKVAKSLNSVSIAISKVTVNG